MTRQTKIATGMRETEARIELTYDSGRSSGSVDILAWHAATASLLVIEIKTEIPSAEATLRKLDEKVRVAPAVAAARFGWHAAGVSRLLVIEATSTNRRRIRAHLSLFDSALPLRDDAVRTWLRRPTAPVDGRLFVSSSNHRGGIHVGGGRHRVRVPRRAHGFERQLSTPDQTATTLGIPGGIDAPAGRPPTILRG